MMLKLNILILLSVVFSSFCSKAQEKGEVNFLVEVDNGYFEILVDDSIYLKIYKTNLEAGHHTAKIWSPGYITTEVDFDIVAGETSKILVPMALSNERKQFESDYKAYRMKFHKSLTLPASITLASFLGTSSFMIAAYDKKRKIEKDISSYHQTPMYSEVIFYKNRIAENNLKYNRYRTVYYTMLSLTAVSLGTTIFTYSKFKKNNTEPVLNSKSPFKDRFSLYMSPLGCRLILRVG